LTAGAALLAHSIVDTPTTSAYVAVAIVIILTLALIP
jgi:hypothetical protein